VNTVLVTIVGPEGRTDAAAPADTPVRELLATFAQLTGAGAADPAGWHVGPPGHSPLLADGTLGDQGVVDGSVLHLRPRSPEPVVAVAALAPPGDAADDGSTPVERTRDALPEWLGLGGRLRAACRADAGGASVRGSWPARVRAGWHETCYRRRLEEAIRARRLSRPVTIAVVSPSAGAGRTTIATLLGSLLAQLRADRGLVLDTAAAAAPGRPRGVAAEDLLSMLEQGLTPTQLDAYLAPANDGLELLPVLPGADAQTYQRVIGRLRETAGVLVVDCGGGLEDPSTQAALATADHVVVVVEAGAASALLVARAAAVLGDDAPPAILVVNRVPARGQDVSGLEHEIPAARGLIAVHDDPRRAEQLRAGELTWSERTGAWDLPLRELAALLAAEWVRSGVRPAALRHPRDRVG
jgi:MinD-like ATPase involved in chromosome partitioning or flagellar assembly